MMQPAITPTPCRGSGGKVARIMPKFVLTYETEVEASSAMDVFEKIKAGQIKVTSENFKTFHQKIRNG